MQCSNCKTELSTRDKYCPTCGHQNQDADAAGKMPLEIIEKRLLVIENRLAGSKNYSDKYWTRAWSIFGHILMPAIIIWAILIFIAIGIPNIIKSKNVSDVKTTFNIGPNAAMELSKNLLNTKLDFVKVKYNEDKWKVKQNADDANRYEFNNSSGDGYGLLIVERIGMDIKTLRKIAITNAKNAAPNTRVTKEEFKTVNDVKMLCLDMEGTLSGIDFYYHGYYWSNNDGTVQFITYSSKNLFHEFESDFNELLEGLQIKEQ